MIISKKNNINKGQQYLILTDNNPEGIEKMMTQGKYINCLTSNFQKKNWKMLDYILLEGKWDFIWKTTSNITSWKDKKKYTLYNYPFVLNKHRLCNHIPNPKAIASKSGLKETLKKFKKILPKTFTLSNKGIFTCEVEKFIKYSEKYAPIWIVKPDFEHSGNNINIFVDYKEVINYITEQMKVSKSDTYIAQKYITNPLLINKNKFDIRLLVLLLESGDLYYYTEGFCKGTLVPYYNKEGKINTFDNLHAHITNVSYQSKNNLGNNIFNFEELNKYIDVSVLFPVWVDMIKQIFNSCKDILFIRDSGDNNMHGFGFFGLDILLDDKLKTWLIEININPGTSIDFDIPWYNKLMKDLLEQLRNIAIDPFFNKKNINNSSYFGKWEKII